MTAEAYDLNLVALALVIAVVSTILVLELPLHIARSSRKTAFCWLVAGSIALGIGIWSMHFVGMLAFESETAHSYDVVVVALALLIGVFASALTIWVASRRTGGLHHTLRPRKSESPRVRASRWHIVPSSKNTTGK